MLAHARLMRYLAIHAFTWSPGISLSKHLCLEVALRQARGLHLSISLSKIYDPFNFPLSFVIQNSIS